MFNRLVAILPPEFPASVDLRVIPEDQTLSNIFAMPRLRRLEIFKFRLLEIRKSNSLRPTPGDHRRNDTPREWGPGPPSVGFQAA
jgi:hypothetical protein